MVSAVWGWTEGRRTAGVRNQGIPGGEGGGALSICSGLMVAGFSLLITDQTKALRKQSQASSLPSAQPLPQLLMSRPVPQPHQMDSPYFWGCS